jgi:hypothetical protein
MRFVPVSREKHHGKRLRPLTSFAFAAGSSAAEVTVDEIAQAAAAFPLFFTRQPEGLQLTALLGLVPGKSLFVDAAGAWSGSHIPASLRGYPFQLAMAPGSSGPTLLIDEDASLLSDSEGEPLFGTEEGEPNGPLAQVLGALTRLSLDLVRTRALVAQLHESGVLKPVSASSDEAATNLLTFDPAALAALPDEKLLALGRSGALAVAYGQLISQGQLAHLQARARA